MKLKLALLALALLTTPASAATWYNEDGSRKLISGPVETDSFLSVTLNAEPTICHVEKWAIGSPIATMKCDNGTSPSVEIISSDRMRFDGEIFTIGSDAQ